MRGKNAEAPVRNPSAPRSSLALRISVYYAGQMLLFLLPQLLLFALAYGGIVAFRLSAPVAEALDGARAARDAGVPNVYISLLGADGRTLLGGLPPGVGGGLFARDAETGRDYILFSRHIDANGEARTARVAIDLTQEIYLLFQLLIALAALYALWVISCARRGRKASDRLFKPIYDITRTAQSLSEKNLSERINVEGTKSELKDLAAVINDMLDRIEQAYNTQKVFVSDASHELRTPIAVIQGYAEMLDRWGKQEPEIRDEAIAAILSESKGMQDLVEKLLYLARHDKNAIQRNREPFDAAEMVDEAARETAIIAGDREILIGKLQSVVIPGDRVALKQALRIFIENALKYTQSGGKITLSCFEEARACHIVVEDTGAGIAKEDLAKIFDRFYRADPARASGTPGHGLGLSIARLIAVSHGGKILVKSKLGAGSQFQLLLPM
jgi:signal transduction histidine kinase